MAINSKTDICNMALQHLGNFGSVNNIDNPATDKEKVFSLWYDNTLKTLLKSTMPNFALKRDILAAAVVPVKFGYKNAYPLPNDCLKLLGIDDIDRKLEYRYTVEGGFIYTDDDFPDGMPIRYVAFIQDVNSMSPEFIDTFAIQLAHNAALPITQDINKKQLMAQLLTRAIANLTGVNAQENLPVRRSESRFRAARYSYPSMNRGKK